MLRLRLEPGLGKRLVRGSYQCCSGPGGGHGHGEGHGLELWLPRFQPRFCLSQALSPCMGPFCKRHSDTEELQLQGRDESTADPRFREVPSPVHEQEHCWDPVSPPKPLQIPLLCAHFLDVSRARQEITYRNPSFYSPRGWSSPPTAWRTSQLSCPGFLPSPSVLSDPMGRSEMK